MSVELFVIRSVHEILVFELGISCIYELFLDPGILRSLSLQQNMFCSVLFI